VTKPLAKMNELFIFKLIHLRGVLIDPIYKHNGSPTEHFEDDGWELGISQ